MLQYPCYLLDNDVEHFLFRHQKIPASLNFSDLIEKKKV
jgi:hypothetical protein